MALEATFENVSKLRESLICKENQYLKINGWVSSNIEHLNMFGFFEKELNGRIIILRRKDAIKMQFSIDNPDNEYDDEYDDGEEL